LRFASLGNGVVLVNYDEFGRIVDLYYPYVGLENQTGGNNELIYVKVDQSKEVSELSPSVRFVPRINALQTELDLDKIMITKTDFLDVYDPIVYRITRFYNPENAEKTVSLASLST